MRRRGGIQTSTTLPGAETDAASRDRGSDSGDGEAAVQHHPGLRAFTSEPTTASTSENKIMKLQ